MKLMKLIKITKNIYLVIDHSLLNQKKESIKNKRNRRNRKSIKNKKSIGERDQDQNLNQYNIKNKEERIIKDHAHGIKNKRKEIARDQKTEKINPNGIEIDSL
jgi:thioredoxin reductase